MKLIFVIDANSKIFASNVVTVLNFVRPTKIKIVAIYANQVVNIAKVIMFAHNVRIFRKNHQKMVPNA